MRRQNGPPLTIPPGCGRELPAGSELLIAFTLGIAGWWVIIHTVVWLAE